MKGATGKKTRSVKQAIDALMTETCTSRLLNSFLSEMQPYFAKHQCLSIVFPDERVLLSYLRTGKKVENILITYTALELLLKATPAHPLLLQAQQQPQLRVIFISSKEVTNGVEKTFAHRVILIEAPSE
jgi:hypothetical protein